MISAIILAAGESKRMGQPKMLLAWNTTTVLGQVISTFREGGVTDIVVVTGGGRQHVERIARQHNARSIFNPDFASGEMLSSLQIGLKAQTPETRATLIGLGDQPQIQVETVLLLCEIFREREAKLIVPSFQRRRGHPWLVKRSLWSDLLRMKSPQTGRDFLNVHSQDIHYVDVDTPEDYKRSQP
jgi:molybdenum cofactor cytidylyltransferase